MQWLEWNEALTKPEAVEDKVATISAKEMKARLLVALAKKPETSSDDKNSKLLNQVDAAKRNVQVARNMLNGAIENLIDVYVEIFTNTEKDEVAE